MSCLVSLLFSIPALDCVSTLDILSVGFPFALALSRKETVGGKKIRWR